MKILVKKTSLFLIFALLAGFVFAQNESAKRLKENLRLIQTAANFDELLKQLQDDPKFIEPIAIPAIREAIWQKYLREAQTNQDRNRAFENGFIEYSKGKMGQFTITQKGAWPEKGFPVFIALHGGGGGPKEMNDEQWDQMQKYYLSSIDTGLYIAPRGPNNTWNLHFDEDAQQFYAKIFAEVRLLKGVDPNRIYLLGYSAGGDGVYQLAPRFADQLAAASMSAGHHNGVSAVNLQHLPMLLQVGELDDAYDRNKETVKYSNLLDSLNAKYPNDYEHQVYVHAGQQHSYVKDRQGAAYEATVIEKPKAWLKNAGEKSTVLAKTDAVNWLNQFQRDPYPHFLRWDLSTRTAGNPTWYWLGMNPRSDFKGVVELKFDSEKNQFELDQPIPGLRIYLHEAMVDLSRKMSLKVGEKVIEIELKPSMKTIAKCISERNDVNFAFWQVIEIKLDAKGEFEIQ